MEFSQARSGSYVLGGIFVGLWAYLLLFRVPDIPVNVAAWTFWGVVGFAIAGGLLAARMANDGARIAIWIAVGVAVGLLGMAALFQRVGEAFASLFTFCGGGLIAAVIPVRGAREV